MKSNCPDIDLDDTHVKSTQPCPNSQRVFGSCGSETQLNPLKAPGRCLALLLVCFYLLNSHKVDNYWESLRLAFMFVKLGSYYWSSSRERGFGLLRAPQGAMQKGFHKHHNIEI
jgi:hypothetical protein